MKMTKKKFFIIAGIVLVINFIVLIMGVAFGSKIITRLGAGFGIGLSATYLIIMKNMEKIFSLRIDRAKLQAERKKKNEKIDNYNNDDILKHINKKRRNN